MGILSRIFGKSGPTSASLQPIGRDQIQESSPPIIGARCSKCGDSNWLTSDGSDIDLDSDWLNLNPVLVCLKCGNKGLIDDATHKKAAAALGIDVPDSFLRLGYSAQEYLEAGQKS